MALALAAAGGFHHIAGRGRLSLVRARATGANALVQRIFDLSSAGDLDGAAAALDALEPADVALEPVAPGPSVGYESCLLYTSPSPRDKRQSRMPSSA